MATEFRNSLKREELAWAAGFVDGEGHFGLHHSVISLNITQKDRQVLDRFCLSLGLGKVYGPYTYGAKKTKSFGFYCHNFEETQAAIAILWSWLSPIKKLQAKKTLVAYAEYLRRPKLKLGPTSRK